MEDIRDDGGKCIEPGTWLDAEDFLEDVRAQAATFRLDRQEGQSTRLVLMCEAGMVPQLAGAVEEYGLPVISSGGFESVTEKYRFHTPKAIRTAREALGITPQKAGMHEGWLWGLPKVPNHPPKMPNHPEDAHSRKWAPSAPEGNFGVFEQPSKRPTIGAQPPSENGGNPYRCSTPKMSTYAGNEHLCADQVDLEERAAILEYDAGLTRAEAEALAAKEFPELPAFLDRRARP